MIAAFIINSLLVASAVAIHYEWLDFLTGLETLTGLVLITWTASFMFIEMQKFWK